MSKLADMTAEHHAVQIACNTIKEIKKDIADGYIPQSVRTFSQLHDYVDANEYLIIGLEACGYELDAASELQAAISNRAMDIVNVWLGAK